jgi:para-aminobenzoate synthetase component I
LTGSSIWKCYDFSGSPWEIFKSFSGKPHPFFLDSNFDLDGMGRYSIIGFDPFWVLESSQKSLFTELRQNLERFKLRPQSELGPFLAGAVGYLSYDAGFLLEKIASRATDDLHLPLAKWGFYDFSITVDHWLKKLYIFSSGFPEKTSHLAARRAEWRMKQVAKELSAMNFNSRKGGYGSIPNPGEISDEPQWISNFSRAQYINAVKKAQRHIVAGDIYQVNLSQRFCFSQKSVDYLGIYERLRNLSPTAFSAILDCGGFRILSASPERFLQLRGRQVVTRPMKGTRKRGEDIRSDDDLKRELLNSPKDRAELLMIVDLERNDLGKVCEYGSVAAKAMHNLEAYSTVFQTTATIEGRLHREKDRIDLIKAAFPGGSITGCPKIRSMEIIEELEPVKRAIYTGSLGYLSFTGDMDLNILIRTLLVKPDKLYFQVGGGIVFDSRPEDEYNETLVKARALFSCLGSGRKILAGV